MTDVLLPTCDTCLVSMLLLPLLLLLHCEWLAVACIGAAGDEQEIPHNRCKRARLDGGS